MLSENLNHSKSEQSTQCAPHTDAWIDLSANGCQPFLVFNFYFLAAAFHGSEPAAIEPFGRLYGRKALRSEGSAHTEP